VPPAAHTPFLKAAAHFVVNYSLLLLIVLIVAFVGLIVIWVAIEVWREEVKLRVERRRAAEPNHHKKREGKP
jgi:hypothetical protein